MIVCTEESRFDDDDVFRGLRVDSLPTTLPTSVRWAGVDSERPLLTGRSLITAGCDVVDFSWFSAASDSLILLYTRDSNRKHLHHIRFNESFPGEPGLASYFLVSSSPCSRTVPPCERPFSGWTRVSQFPLGSLPTLIPEKNPWG